MNNRIEIKACIVCGSTDHQTELLVTDWLVTQEKFNVKRCNKCLFRFTANPPSAEAAGKYYETEEYVEHSDNNDGFINKLYHFGRKWMMKYKLSLIQNLQTGNRLLDVGSGAGYFLNFMQQSGYAVEGVEISEKAVKGCKDKYNIDAYHPSRLIGNKIEINVDIITLWHVFEHVYEYDEYFNSFSKLLSKDGRLIIAMPNYKCLEEKIYRTHWNGYDTPRHLWHFTPETFKKFAADRGFEIVKMKSLPLDPFYNSMISASYKKSFTLLPITLLNGILSSILSSISLKHSSSIVYILKKK